MLKIFIDKFVFDFINVSVQLIIAGAGWAAFLLERQKAGGTTKVKLKMQVGFKQSCEKGKAIVEIELQIVNIGMATVYIEEWGIELRGFRRKKRRILISDEMIMLESGKPEKKSFYYPKKRVLQEAFLRDKVYIYVKCRLGQIIYSKEKYRYFEFEREYIKVNEPSETANKEIEEII